MSAFWLGTADLLDDLAVERRDDLVEGHVLITARVFPCSGCFEQVGDVLRDAEDPQPLGRVDHGRLGLAQRLVGHAVLLGGVEADLLDGALELGLHPLAGVPGDEHRVLADDILRS